MEFMPVVISSIMMAGKGLPTNFAVNYVRITNTLS